MQGFSVIINGNQVVAVSTDELNILTVQIHGDVIGDELAVLKVFGGNYTGEDTDTHLVWIEEYKVTEKDEIEIVFHKSIESSSKGKTIEELHQDQEEQAENEQSIEDIFDELSEKPKNRESFCLKLSPSFDEAIISSTSTEDFSFYCGVMWKWLHPEKASVWLTSNTLNNIKEKKKGTSHARLNIGYEQSVKLNVST